MARARRRTSAPARSRVGSVLFAIGCLSVLGGTFAAGALADRYWTGRHAAADPPPAATSRAERPSKGGDARRASPPATLPARPKLTFYEELTAPLRPATAAPKPARPERERTAASEGRFTVQVGTYRARPQAEAVRTGLVEAGHGGAYVTSMDAPDGVRYRVRVGSFKSREDAQRLAALLESEGSKGAYVTAR